jgi:hypothetical protein
MKKKKRTRGTYGILKATSDLESQIQTITFLKIRGERGKKNDLTFVNKQTTHEGVYEQWLFLGGGNDKL